MASSERINLTDALTQLVPEAKGKRSMSLIKTDQLRVVLIRMTTGGEMHEHFAPGQITIHPVGGRFDVTVVARRESIGTDSILTIDAGVRHAVMCREDGAFLLTIAWPHGAESPVHD